MYRRLRYHLRLTPAKNVHFLTKVGLHRKYTCTPKGAPEGEYFKGHNFISSSRIFLKQVAVSFFPFI